MKDALRNYLKEHDEVENIWEQWEGDGFINCKGEDD